MILTFHTFWCNKKQEDSPQFSLAVRYKLELGLRAINLCPKLDDRIQSEPESPYSEHHGWRVDTVMCFTVLPVMMRRGRVFQLISLGEKTRWKVPGDSQQRLSLTSPFSKCICPYCKLYLSHLQNVFVHIAKSMCPNCKMYIISPNPIYPKKLFFTFCTVHQLGLA